VTGRGGRTGSDDTGPCDALAAANAPCVAAHGTVRALCADSGRPLYQVDPRHPRPRRDGAAGAFFEGAITASSASQALDGAIQANVVAAGYGR